MTTTETLSELSAATTIRADPAQVWALVSDVARMSSWSPQVAKVLVLGGPVRLGTRFLNINREGWRVWPTSARVVRFAPHQDFAFRVTENSTVWSFRLEAVEGGTLLTHRRELPEGISALSRGLIKVAFGGQGSFDDLLTAGMEQTLARMKAELEG